MNLHYRKQLGSVLVLLLNFIPRLVYAAPYVPLDCAAASTAAEIAVCKSYVLGQDEARVATLFSVLTSLVAMGQRADLVDAQRRWITVREACGGNAECLSRAYQARLNELLQTLNDLKKCGPL